MAQKSDRKKGEGRGEESESWALEYRKMGQGENLKKEDCFQFQTSQGMNEKTRVPTWEKTH